jgi:sarcosine oxidase gamma subunit
VSACVVSLRPFVLETAGLSIRPRADFKVGALRYFNAADALPAGLLETLGRLLPAPLEAAICGGPGSALILAWRSPKETLVLSREAAVFEALAQRTIGAGAWGCFVDQTGGLTVWEVTGSRTPDLLERLGSAASAPQLGEARTSRMADLAVLALRVEAGATLLILDRLYAEHLLGWMGAITADF